MTRVTAGPAGPPPVIYSDRAAGTQQAYPDRDNGVPAAGVVYPQRGSRPASAGGHRPPRPCPPGVTGTVQQQAAVGADGRPMVLVCAAARGTAGSRARAAAAEPAPPGSRLPHQGAGRHHHRRYAEHLSLLRARRRPGDPLRRPRRPRRLHLDRRAEDHPQGRVAGLASADRDDRAPALSAALHGRRPRQSARRARDVSRLDRLPHPRHQPALDDRQVRLVGLHRHAERGRLRPVRTRQGRHPRRRAFRAARRRERRPHPPRRRPAGLPGRSLRQPAPVPGTQPTVVPPLPAPVTVR